jgi:cyclophilin family peptidyl-prolyl cis-trans isomerase
MTKTLRNIIFFNGVFLLAVGLAGCTKGCKPEVANPEATPVASVAPQAAGPGETAQPAQGPVDLAVDATGLSHATVTIETPRGKIKFKFYSKDAPKTTDRLVELIQKGFYNGLTFHRVEDWVIQGGDPTGIGSGGSGQRLKAEFNLRKHREGTLGMARSMDPDSADSQFYIVFTTAPHLDGQYTVFGQVIEGMDVVRKIQKSDKMLRVSIQ